jgi:hypothetical protein
MRILKKTLLSGEIIYFLNVVLAINKNKNWREIMKKCLVLDPPMVWEEIMCWGVKEWRNKSLKANVCKLAWSATYEGRAMLLYMGINLKLRTNCFKKWYGKWEIDLGAEGVTPRFYKKRKWNFFDFHVILLTH